MAWLSRNNFSATDKLHADDMNNLANDNRTWGGNVNGGGYTLSNVVLASSVIRAAVAVTSVFGRTGDVVAVATDYTPAFIGAVPATRQILTPAGSGLAGGGALSQDLTLSALVTSVFGRTGAVTLTSADISGATGVLTSRNVNTGTGLTGGGNLSVDRTLSVVPDSVNQQVQVLAAGTPVGTRHAINFINGANVTVSVADNSLANRLDITIASAGVTGGGMADPTTTLGDLIVRGATAPTRLGIGTNGQVLTVDTTQTLGVKWAAITDIAGVSSFAGRTGAVVPATADYSAAMVTNAVDATQSYNNPVWIATLPWSKISNAPAFMPDPTTTKGDLIAHGAATGRLAVGADGQILTADSTQTLGVRWGAPPVSPQTPWTSGQDAVGYNLTHLGAIAVGGATAGVSSSYPVVVQLATADAAVAASSVQLTDANTMLLTGCSGTYNSTGGTGAISGAPWLQAYDKTHNPTSLILQPVGPKSFVGVGQPQPAYALDVSGDINCSGSLRVAGVAISTGEMQTPWTQNINAANYTLGSVSYLGVGAAADGTNLALFQGVKPTVKLYSATAGDQISFQIGAGDTSAGGYLWDMGIGFAGLGQFYIRDVLNGVRLQINAQGQVGVGHTAAFTLDVLGDVNCTGTYRLNGVAIGGVASVFGRTGIIVAQTGDYTASQVTNAVDMTQVYTNPAWITSLDWSKITGAPAVGVSSVFGRAGAVTATAGDYSYTQVTNAVGTPRKINTGTGLTGGGDLSADRTLSVVPDTTNQQVLVLSGGGVIGTRHAINFMNGANVTISVSDDPTNNRVDVAIASSGGGTGGGMTDPTTTLGDLIVRGSAAPNRLSVGLDGNVLTADSTQPLGVKWAPTAAGSQTPWVSDIDAASHKLTNVASIAVEGNVSATGVLATSVQTGLSTADYITMSDLDLAWYSATNSLRWNVGKQGAETGSNAGSSLAFYSFDDTGAALAVPLFLERTGNVGIKQTAPAYALDVAGDCNVTGAFRINGVALTPNGLVTSVFTRTGAVAAQTGDYTAAQVTNAVSTIGSYADPPWLVSLAWTKIVSPPAFLVDPTTTKGDLIVRGTSTTRLPAGVDGQVLTADSTQTLGVRWGSVVSGVSSFNTRTGAVVPVSGDYTAAQVTNAVSTAASYASPAWLTQVQWSIVAGAPAFLVNPLTAKGDIITYGTAPAKLAVGSDGQVLMADSTQTLGVKWAANAASQWVSGTGGIYYSAGNVGIGSVNSATIRLHVAAASSDTVPHAEFFATDAAPSATVQVGCSVDYGSNKEAGWIQAKDTSSGVPVPLILQSQGVTGAGHNAGVGIGQTNPAYALDVLGDCNITGTFRVNGSPFIGGYWSAGSGGAIYYSAGNVGIGTSSPQVILQAGTNPNFGGIEGRTDGPTGAANYARFGGFYSTNPIPGAAIAFFAQGSGGQRGSIGLLTKNVDDNTSGVPIRMWVDQGGNVGIGTSSPSYALDVNGQVRSQSGGYIFPDGTTQTTAAGATYWLSDGTGIYYNSPVFVNGQPHSLSGWWFYVGGTAGGSTIWNQTSDVRIKENIQPVTDDPLPLLAKLNWVRYEHNGLAGTTRGTKGIGLLAHELAAVMPEALAPPMHIALRPGEEETDLLSIGYHVVWVQACRAIVALTGQIDALRAEIQQLKGGKIS